MRTYTLAALAIAISAGCHGTDPALGDDQPVVDAPDGMADAYIPPSGYTKLIGRTWTLAAGQTDIYRCVRLTIPTDTYITSIEAQAPLGTHHTVLSIATGSNVAGADGEYDCSAGTLGMQMLYASGVGTSPLDFPSGVGIKVAGGTQIHLNLHLYNAGDTTLTGESAIWVKSSSTPPATLAEMVFAGKFAFGIPNGATNYDVTGGCTASTSSTLFAVWPHMHKLATHSKFEIIRSATDNVLHDMDYMFAEQRYWLQSPGFQVQSGDQIKVTCTYTNTTGSYVTFGDGSDKEMCFVGMYRYPAQNAGLFQCTDMPNF